MCFFKMYALHNYLHLWNDFNSRGNGEIIQKCNYKMKKTLHFNNDDLLFRLS